MKNMNISFHTIHQYLVMSTNINNSTRIKHNGSSESKRKVNFDQQTTEIIALYTENYWIQECIQSMAGLLIKGNTRLIDLYKFI